MDIITSWFDAVSKLNPTTVGLWITALIGIGTILKNLAGSITAVYDHIHKRFRPKAPGSLDIPTETVRVLRKSPNEIWWHMGAVGADPSMQIVCGLNITNISKLPIYVQSVELSYGWRGRKRIHGHILIQGEKQFYGSYPIPPGAMRGAHVNFWIYPPVKKANETFSARSVSLTDQFGNRHSLRDITFKYM
jgi:hypothetical protein